ncbi:unnamed protein product [Prorocentrum cordatum]|uniref:Uncharacterized protein n=1 Tax=Prorocentrum cordatum TaxID=2364126 RepID=A0ABN9XFX6_9DINO|nr:unnamed protein product [Polarella glacialis]
MTSEALKSSACGSSGPRRLCPQRHTWAAAAAAGPTARRGAMLPLVNVCACLGGARGGRRERRAALCAPPSRHHVVGAAELARGSLL